MRILLTLLSYLWATLIMAGNYAYAPNSSGKDLENPLPESSHSLGNIVYFKEKERAENLLYYNRDTAILVINTILKKAEFAHDTALLGEVYYLKGLVSYMNAGFDTATQYFLEAARLASKSNLPQRQAIIYVKIADNLFLTDQSDQAIDYLSKGWDIYEQSNDLNGRARVLITIARHFDRLGLAEQYNQYLKLLRISYLPYIQDSLIYVQICQMNASQLARSGRPQMARGIYNIGLKYMPKQAAVLTQLGISRTLSEIYYHDGRKEQAIKILNEAGIKAMGKKQGLEASNIYNLIAHYLQQEEKNDEALVFQRKAMRLREAVGYQIPIISVYVNYAIALRKAHQYDSVPYYLQKALDLAHTAHYVPDQERASTEMADYYFMLGDFKNALLHLRNANYFENQLTSRLMKNQKKMLVSKIVIFGTTQEITSLKSRIRANLWLMVLIIFVGVLVIVAFSLALKNRKRESDLQLLEIKRKILVTNLSPIFIFNSLVAIKNIIRSGKNEEAGRYLSSFARLIRVIMASPQVDFHPVDKEVAIMENYFQLQQIWLGNRFSYELKVPPELLGNRYVIPPFFCHPVLEQIIYSSEVQKHSAIHASLVFSLKQSFILQEIKLQFFDVPDPSKDLYLNPKIDRILDLTLQRLDTINRSLLSGSHGTFAVEREEADKSVIFRISFAFPT
ncbi:MAG: histidine kinase [Bacteroidales bacterium]